MPVKEFTQSFDVRENGSGSDMLLFFQEAKCLQCTAAKLGMYA